MEGVAILVPVLGRPHRIQPLLQSIARTTPQPYRVLFIANTDDTRVHTAIEWAKGDPPLIVDGTYSQKINAGVKATTEPLLLLAADDLEFRQGWLENAKAHMKNGVQVVGLNDLIERPARPTHATHFLMTREAAELPCIDGSPGPLCLEYAHWGCDDELIGTATKRGMYAYAEDAQLRHLHIMNGLAPDDETYRLGRANARLDLRRLRRRMPLWT